MTATLPVQDTFQVGDRWTAAAVNEQVRDAINFLLGSGTNYKPMAQAYNSANISLTSGTSTLMTMNSEQYDTDALHDTGSNTGRMNFTLGGLWEVEFYVRFASNATGRRELNLRLNSGGSSSGGTSIHTHTQQTVSTSTADVYRAIKRRFTAGDYVELFALQDSGSTINAVGSASNPYGLGMSVRWLAA